LDRERAMPYAEVLGGWAPRATEQRANAFAAELLLPRAVAGKALAEGGNPKREVERLARHYGASREIIAWQALRSNDAHRLATATVQHLALLVDDPERLWRAYRAARSKRY
jgi:hypothetical protein